MTESQRVPKGTRQRWVEANEGRFVCACGCGQAIPLRPEHHSVGVPTYIHGHNTRSRKRKALPPTQLCACGCGADTKPGRRFVNGHNQRGQARDEAFREERRRSMTGANNPQYGKRPHNFKGRIVTSDGYVMIYRPDHPFASTTKAAVMEHRLVLEEHLREMEPSNPHLVEIDGELYLRPDVEVHHRDGIKGNNIVENLVALTKSDHAALHHQAKDHPSVCSETGCGRPPVGRGWCSRHYWLLWTKPRQGK